MLARMCVSISFEMDGRAGSVELPPPSLGRLPVRRRGRVEWMRWGSIDVARDEILEQRYGYAPLHFPDGGLVGLDQLRAGQWVIYDPGPTLIVATHFSMSYIRGRRQCFAVPAGGYIHGCIATIGKARRLYVVTVRAPIHEASQLLAPDRWPRVVYPR